VPLAFLGGGVAPGLRDDPASSLDAVPSLLALLGWSAEELAALDLDGRDLGLQR
jgi:arylsulfatase A-like enzyme